ncbi:[FeFe] hydrogenase, group A [bacterium]|nr:[FeFe] hydrogenase, group A [bacterium]
MINLTIDNQRLRVPEGTTIFEAARKVGIDIPHLCYHEELSIYGACRICVVEVEGMPRLEASCSTPVEEGMRVKTNTSRVRRARKMNIELLLANHPEDCIICNRSQVCELYKLAHDIGVRELKFEKGRKYHYEPDLSSPAIIRDPNKCILCSRCIRVCLEIQAVGVIDFVNRGGKTQVLTAFNKGLNNVECTTCGQCILTCPTGALRGQSAVDEVWEALSHPRKFTVVQPAPAIRGTIGEEFGMKPGSLVSKRLAAALRRLGFDKVFDINFGADLTATEEAHELLARIAQKRTLPMFTSCCPAWVKYLEHFYPELIPHLSTCKSPQQMAGAVTKTYYAQKAGLNPRDIFVVSIMPCTAKKFELKRPEMRDSGFQDEDASLTTRELTRMLREVGIDLARIDEEEFDSPLGIYSGAGAIFGVTGGLTEAALRTAYEVATGKRLKNVEFKEVRGFKGIREAEIELNGTKVKVAIAHGLANASLLAEEVKKGNSPYHFIEIMACPGGCVGGGGQPLPTTREVREKRGLSLYREDKRLTLRRAHKNPAVIALYKEYLGKPLSKKAHHLLHTTYTRRSRY